MYDAAGNIVRQIDGRGNSVWTWYDKLGRRVAQVDAENYLTAWDLDTNGNVPSETRHATRVTMAFDATTSVAALKANVGTSGNDRTTQFTYDRNGRRLSELRLGVAYSVVNAGGSLTSGTGTAAIYYGYNKLGQLSVKVEANGDQTENFYDAMGRLSFTREAQFENYNNINVRKDTINYYDGLNNLSRTLVRAADGVQDGNRITLYWYNKGGGLSAKTDAAGFYNSFYYDKAGRLTSQTYWRAVSDPSNPSGIWEAQSYAYDAAGRQTTQRSFAIVGGAWTQQGDTRTVGYNAYGEVSSSGVNGIAQESSSYDALGRVWRSNEGDGTVKLYLYDGAGNRTLTIASNGAALPSGYSWSTITVDQAVALLTNNGASPIGTVAVAGMVVTISVYDKRGQLVETREPLRQVSPTGSATLTTTTISKRWTYNAHGEVTQEIDARNNVTDFAYNTMGRLIQRQSPTVSWTAENGAIASARPTEDYYYDIAGRLVACATPTTT